MPQKLNLNIFLEKFAPFLFSCVARDWLHLDEFLSRNTLIDGPIGITIRLG
jgi:hypothetical protein